MEPMLYQRGTLDSCNQYVNCRRKNIYCAIFSIYPANEWMRTCDFRTLQLYSRDTDYSSGVIGYWGQLNCQNINVWTWKPCTLKNWSLAKCLCKYRSCHWITSFFGQPQLWKYTFMMDYRTVMLLSSHCYPSTFDYAGLQIKDKNDKWVDVPPRPNSLVLNVGDTLVELVGGLLKAMHHRVINIPNNIGKLLVSF